MSIIRHAETLSNVVILQDEPVALQPTTIHAFDINEFVLQYVPPFLRHAKLVGYLRSLLAPLVSYRYRLLTSIYPAIERRARYSSQIMVFESLLNYEFGYVSQEITTLDGTAVGRVYVGNIVEADPIYVGNEGETPALYVGNGVEYIPLFDFIVRVPQALYDTQLTRLRSLVNKYKLAGVNYTVIAY